MKNVVNHSNLDSPSSYMIIYKKGYQLSSNIESAVITKVSFITSGSLVASQLVHSSIKLQSDLQSRRTKLTASSQQIKGTTKVNITKEHPLYNPKFNESKLSLYNRVWDGQDIVYPPKVGDRCSSEHLAGDWTRVALTILMLLCPPKSGKQRLFLDQQLGDNQRSDARYLPGRQRFVRLPAGQSA